MKSPASMRLLERGIQKLSSEADVVVAILTNTHARVGREPWYRRLQSIVNTAFASLA
jgi:hypothetical protein